MDDAEDDARYPPNPSSSFYQSNYHHRRPKLPVRNPSSVQPIPRNYYKEDDDNEEEQEEEDEEEINNFNVGDKYNDENDDDGEEDDDDVVVRVAVEEEDDEDDNEGDDDDDDGDGDNYDEISGRYRLAGTDDFPRPPVKRPRRMDRSALAYEFAPRVKAPTAQPPPPAAAAVTASALKPSTSGPPRGSPIADWSEYATIVLLDAWGDRFLQLGRKSLRSEDWIDVAGRVSEASQAVRTDAQCRNRLDTLKKKYKKEKMKVLEPGSSASKWVYFKKMEKLLSDSPPPRQQPGLSCGVDSGEYVFMNPRVYLNRSNGLDEMRDSPGNSDENEDGEDDSDGLPPKRARLEEADEGGGPDPSSSSSFRMLADSIQRFGEIYEKIENSKKQQLMELEKMRMEFHHDLEVQKRHILEQAQAEIAKIRQGDDDEEIDISIENISR